MARRRRALETQLDLEWDRPMQWQDLPPTVRERVRAALVALLQQAASGDRATESTDAE